MYLIAKRPQAKRQLSEIKKTFKQLVF